MDVILLLHPQPITGEGHRPNIAITFGTEKLEWWSIKQVVNVQSVMICLAVSIQYVCVTDGRTDTLRQHSLHSDKMATLTQTLSMYHGSSVCQLEAVMSLVSKFKSQFTL